MLKLNQEKKEVVFTISPKKPFDLNSRYSTNSYFVLRTIKLTKAFKDPINLFFCSGRRKFALSTVKTNNLITLNKSISCFNKSKLIVEGGELILRGEFHKFQKRSKKQIKNEKKTQKGNNGSQYELKKISSCKENIKEEIEYSKQQICEQKKRLAPQDYQIKKLKEIAVISSKVIRMIIDEKEEGDTLASKIKKLTVDDFAIDIQEENLATVLKLFKGGVNLHPYYMKQVRIMMGRSGKQFIFHPTWMVTTQVFKRIAQHMQEPVQMITGTPGIGKSVSMILYCLLMGRVTEYALRVSKEQLKKDKNIIVRPVKLFYWSLCPTDKIQEVKQRLFLQIPQIAAYYKQEKKTDIKQLELSELCSKIRMYYFQKMQTMVFIDQINLLAKDCRDFNKTQDRTCLTQIKELKIILSELSNLADSKFYNSSVNIEKQLLGKSLPDDFQALDLSKNLYSVDISYQKKMQTNKGKKELIRYFMFQLTKKNFQCFKKQLKPLFQNRTLSFFTPFTILNKIKYLNTYKIMDIFQLLQDIEITRFQEISQSHQIFIQKLQDQYAEQFPIPRIYHLYIKAYTQIANKQQNIVIDGFKDMKLWQNQKYQRMLDLNLFYQNDYEYQFRYSKQLFYEFTISLFAKSYLSDKYKENVTFPILITVFEECLFRGIRNNLSFLPIFNLEYESNEQNTMKKYRISKISEFQQFQNQSQQFGYSKNMEAIFQQAKESQEGTYCLGIPKTLKRRRPIVNFCIDFCIVRYLDEQNNFQVIFYDIRSMHNFDKDKKQEDIQLFKKRFEEVTYQGKKIKNVKFEIFWNQKQIIKVGNHDNFSYANLMTINFQSFLRQIDRKNIKFLLNELSKVKNDVLQ